MPDPIFVQTRHTYDSYRDLWRLVDVSGYATCFVDEIDMQDRDAQYIVPVLNGEWTHPHGRARVIHWCMEFPDNPPQYPTHQGISEVWTADAQHAQQTNLRYVPVGSDVKLRDKGGRASKSPDYDVAMLSYLSGRRNHIAHLLADAGFTLAPNVGPHQDRHETLLNTRVVLHVHQDQRPAISPLRLAVAAAYKLPALSERVENPGIHDCVPMNVYDHLVAHVQSWLEWGDLDDRATVLHERLCKEYTFRKCIEAAL